MTPRARMFRAVRLGLFASWSAVAEEVAWLTDRELQDFITALAEVRSIAQAEQKGRRP